MRRFLVPLLLLALPAAAQKVSEAAVIASLKKDVTFLASDSLEGRRTGTAGEAAARKYIIERYKKMGIPAYGASYDYPFPFTAGKHIGGASQIKIGDRYYPLSEGAFPLPWSANGAAKSARILPLFVTQEDRRNPHFDWEKTAYDQATVAAKQGAGALVFWVPSAVKAPPAFDPRSEYRTLNIPVFLVRGDTMPEAGAEVHLQASVLPDSGTGHNIAAYINNGAPHTVVVGAHYDHLGYGEDGSSLLANAAKRHEIHNGADDNASGTAAVMELAARTKKARLKNYNYLFVHFSGEELGLLGSKAFVKAAGMDSTNTAAMINLDMVGRLVDSTKALTIGGVGTSPVWGSIIPKTPFRIVTDSSGIGPSDHTSFYNAGIPVLFFFTGTHHDYHKPTDDAEKVNYAGEAMIIAAIQNVLQKLDAGPKPRFTATKSNAVGKVRFKVTLGIMPDYSFNEGGVRVDGVTEGKPAATAGVRPGDILTRLGDREINGMQSYMEALGSFKSGDATQLRLKREGKELTVPVKFQ